MEHSAVFSIQHTNTAQSLQKNAITVFGPRLYNSLPKYLRHIESVKTEKFKFELDKFLELIPDEPKMRHRYTLSGRIGKVVASHVALARLSPAEVELIYTTHVALRGYCP